MDSGRIARLPKAEDWLSLVAEHVDTVWDQDALVYLRSRGRDCHDQVNRLIHSWNVGGQQGLDRDFWDAPALGDYSVEATILRTADWCEIEGFESWWGRLAQSRQERLLGGGIEDPLVAAYWLFNMVRSDYALRLLPGVLDGYLGSISLTSPNKPLPWVFGDALGPDDVEHHLAYASALIFARYRLRSNDANAGLIDQAVAALCRYQDQSGAWRASTSDPEMSIEATAMALHALALAQPRGWPRLQSGSGLALVRPSRRRFLDGSRHPRAHLSYCSCSRRDQLSR